MVPLNRGRTSKSREDMIVTAYLDCPNGHKNPYRVKKTYSYEI